MAKSLLSVSKRLKRKRFFLRLFLLVLLFLFFGAASVVSLFWVERLKIKEIVVSGVEGISEEVVVNEAKAVLHSKYFGIIPRDRIFTFPEDMLKQSLLSRFKKIESVFFEAGFDQVAHIYIKERKPAGLLCGNDNKKCFFLDKTGFIFDSAPYFSDGVFVKFEDEREKKPELGDFLLEEVDQKRVFDFFNRFSSDYVIKKVKIKEEGIYEFYTNSGWYLILESKDNWDMVYDNFLSSVDEILNEKNREIEYIDLRFGNKVFFK